MKTRSIAGFFATSLAAIGFSACQHHEDARGVEVPVVGPEAHLKTTAREIVAARCDREARCDNVGPSKTYADRNACTSKLSAETESDLNLKDCPRGVDRAKVDECLSKIHGQECNNPIDALSRVSACRTGALCMDT
jgi:hypothetical protein